LEATTFYARNELIVSPIFEALFDCNILWKSKYFEFFALEHKLYATFLGDWVNKRKRAMNANERILYYLFKRTRGTKLGSAYSGVPTTSSFSQSPRTASKVDTRWELAELYYDTGKPEDEVLNQQA